MPGMAPVVVTESSQNRCGLCPPADFAHSGGMEEGVIKI